MAPPGLTEGKNVFGLRLCTKHDDDLPRQARDKCKKLRDTDWEQQQLLLNRKAVFVPLQFSNVLSVQFPPPRSGLVRLSQQPAQKQLPNLRPIVINPRRVPSAPGADTLTSTSTPESSGLAPQLNRLPDSTATPSSSTDDASGSVKFTANKEHG